MAGILMGGLQNKLADSFTAGDREAALAPLKNFRPSGFNAGGMKFNYQGGQFVGGSDAGRMDIINRASGLFGKQAEGYAGLRSMVAPGFSKLREGMMQSQDARLRSLGDAKTKAIGDLRENLQRRRVFGSSFGQDALSRANAEFAREEDRMRSDMAVQEAATTLQELESTKELISNEFGAAQNSVKVLLDNMNMEAGMAAQFASQATDVLARNAQLQSSMMNNYVMASRQYIENERGREHEVGMKFLDFGMGAMGG